MVRFVLRRLLIETIPSLFVIVTITFFLIRLAPGGPFSSDRSVAPEVLAQLNAHYGLNKPLLAQYGSYLANVVQGNLGPSFRYPGRSVTELVIGAFPVSCELGIYALIIALVVGVGAGIVASLRPNTLSDYAPMTVAMTGICLPTFVLGPLLVLLFSLKLRLVDSSGWSTPADRLLPALTLGLAYAAYIARLTRGGMLEVLGQDFVRTARAKGATELRVVLRHALRGGILPALSFLGPAAAGLITGSFVVETIFAVPGLGRFFVMAAFNRDYTMIMGVVVFYAALIILLNTVVDVAHAALDPRLRQKAAT